MIRRPPRSALFPCTAVLRSIVGGVLSVTVKVVVQVDSLLAPSVTCSVTVITPKPTCIPATAAWGIDSAALPSQTLATTPLAHTRTDALHTPLAQTLCAGSHA